MFSSLPPDCHDLVLGFLPLKDVIQLGATSIRSLSDIQAEIKRRRQRFHQRFCYLSTATSHHHRLDNNKALLYTPGLGEIHLLPTVRDRIDSLVTVLSTSHHCYRQVVELQAAVAAPVTTASEHTVDFESILIAHSINTRAHKLHAWIVHHLLISKPSHVNLGQRNGDVDEGGLTITLERYVGDVLCLHLVLYEVYDVSAKCQNFLD